jgi:hypothetical protein
MSVVQEHADKLGGAHFSVEKVDDYVPALGKTFAVECVAGTNDRNVLFGDSIQAARADPGRRQFVYDAIDLVTIDTARIFAEGVSRSADLFRVML